MSLLVGSIFAFVTFHSAPLKFSTWCEIGSRVLDSWYFVEKCQRKSHAIVIRNFGRLTFSRKTSAHVVKLEASK